MSIWRKALRVWQQEGLPGIIDRLGLQLFGRAPSPKPYTYQPPTFPLCFDAWLTRLTAPPTFSIVVAIYNTEPALLESLWQSVRQQWYPHWQLLLVDDGSPSAATRSALANMSHPQVTTLTLTDNRGISAATNAGITRATGDFIVFLDQSDLLTVDCLYEFSRCIEQHDVDLVYSDEDTIDTQQRYSKPHFKPDWSPDTLMSTMYIGHVMCVRRSLLTEVGGLRAQYDGCQDWDLVLRLSERTTKIRHIAKVLYHGRKNAGSAVADYWVKPQIWDLSKRLREETLQRRQQTATVEALPEIAGYFRIAYAISGQPLISIIIASRDNGRILQRCIDSIQQWTRYRHFEIVLIDNGSIEADTLGYLQRLKTQANIRVIRHDIPFNFSTLMNVGAHASCGELLLFLNDDTEVLQADWLERLAGFAQLAHIGAVGAKLLYPKSQRIQHAGVVIFESGPGHAFLRQKANNPGYYLRNLLEYNWIAVTGACLMLQRHKFEAINGFNEQLSVAYNDVDLCLRLYEAGFYNINCQAVRLIHHESISRGSDMACQAKLQRLARDLKDFYTLHPRFVAYDPFFNPNLKATSVQFELA